MSLLPDETVAAYDLSSMRSILTGTAPVPFGLKAWGVDRFGPCLSEAYGTWRVLDNEHVREVQRIEAGGARTHEEFGDRISGFHAKQHAYDKGDWQKGMLSCSSAAGFADRIEPVADIISRLMREAAASLDAASWLRVPPVRPRLAS